MGAKRLSEADLAVGAFFRRWVDEQRATPELEKENTFDVLAEKLGTSKPNVINRIDANKHPGAGKTIEEGLAKLLFEGSVDKLRKAALEFVAANPDVTPEPVVEPDADPDPYHARAAVRREHRSVYDKLSPRSKAAFDRRSEGAPSKWSEAEWYKRLVTLASDDAHEETEEAAPYKRIAPEKNI